MILQAAACEPSDTIYTSDPIALAVFLLVGLLGGAHCIGMCGPLVTMYADRMRNDHRNVLTLRQVKQHGLFNLGRAMSYTLLGALFGLAGSLVFVSGRQITTIATEVHAVTGILVGTIIVAVGFKYAVSLELPTGRIPGSAMASGMLTRHLVPRVDRWVGDVRIVGLGAAHGLLPCPLLYPAFLYAFVQSDVLGGAAALAALGVGTIPAVFLTGTIFQSVSLSMRLRIHRVLGIAFVVLGYIPLQHGLATLGIALPHPPIPYYQPL